MSKVSNLPTFTSAPNSSQMNDAFTKITEAFDNTVSRDGSSPNTMAADLDLNGNDILNVGTLESENVNVNGTLTVNGSPIGASILVFSSTEDGLVPASGGGTDNFLRADGTWAEPAGGGGGGSSAWGDLTDVPAAVTALSGVNTGDETAAGIITKLLTVDGIGSGLDADLLDGQSSAAFATAAHTHAAADVSAPGSTTQLTYNNAGALAGATGALIEANQLRLPHIGSPATPASGGINLLGQTISARDVPAYITSEGVVREMRQPQSAVAIKPLSTCVVKFQTNGGTGGTVGMVANTFRIWPCPVFPFDQTYTAFGFEVTTAVASSLAKIVIYGSDPATNRPDALLWESASIDCATTGTKTDAVSMTFRAGLTYWIGVRSNSTQTMRSVQGTIPNIQGRPSYGNTFDAVLVRSLTFATSAPSSWGFLASEISASDSPVVIHGVAS